jgi:3-oxoacyl-[acyl-carrier-protein] synthase-3
MAYAVLRNVRYAGLATCTPAQSVSNLDCPPEQKADRERLVRNIGIDRRRVCARGVCFSDLAQKAAEELLGKLGWDRGEVDAVIVVTQSSDYGYPGTAVLMQDRLGLSQSCLAFDINLGCSGYPYGLFALGSMVSAGHIRKALLLVGDKSTNTDSQDMGFVVLFGDAGTATALEFDESAPPMHFDMHSDGSGYKAIYCPVGGNRVPLEKHHLDRVMCEDGVIRRAVDIVLDGPAILNFSITRVPPAITSLLAAAGVDGDTIDYFLFHQANRMINETIRKKLKLPVEKVPSTLLDFGNTSSASIPLTMTMHTRERLAGAGGRVLLSGFGVGLSWSSCILDVSGAVMPALVEHAGAA